MRVFVIAFSFAILFWIIPGLLYWLNTKDDVYAGSSSKKQAIQLRKDDSSFVKIVKNVTIIFLGPIFWMLGD